MKKVVIIDDEQDSVAIIRDVLEAYTCRVYSASSGRAGLKIIEEAQPDLVFLDLRLPDTDGQTILPEIKKISPRTKIIIGTGHGSEQIKEELLKNGADDYFDKPIDINAFERKARQLVGGTLSEIRILIIDDEPNFYAEFKDLLVNDPETKWVPYYAKTGEEGIRLAGEHMPDLISLDLCLGSTHVTQNKRPEDEITVLGGVEIYRQLKAKGFKIPVIILAAYIDSSDAEELVKEGVATVFSKTELAGSLDTAMRFMLILKRIALRGGNNKKAGNGN